MKPPVSILHASGTNRDREAAWACERAGGAPEILHLNQLLAGDKTLADYRLLLLPGGFSFGDDLGAGKLWAVLLRERLGEQLDRFIAAGRPVIGICNGFQALVKAGLLPGPDDGLPARAEQTVTVTLTRNSSARFECRWVTLEPNPETPCVFTRDLTEPITCPVAHGEGRLVYRDDNVRETIRRNGLAALRYVNPNGGDAAYPWNPNGSEDDIAGLTNAAGNVLGLMPHPEDHIIERQHPRHHRGETGGLGLALFTQGLRYAAGLD